MKRILLKVILAVVGVAISVNASAYDFEVDGIYYNIISTGDLTCEVTYKEITSQAKTYTGIINIPTTVNYKNRDWTVVSIGNETFYNCTSLAQVTLHSNINSIGDKAFYNCTMLDNVILPQTVTAIGDSAFYCCSNLNTISLPPLIKTIKRSTFMNSSLKGTLVLPDSLESIEISAFRGTKLTSVSIPSKVKNIEGGAFQSCAELKSVNLPESLTSIGNYAFAECQNLQSIIIPKNVSKIVNDSFYSCSSLIELKIDSENKTFDSRDNCNAVIETATNKLIIATPGTIIPNSVTTIASYAFKGVNIKELTIPASVLEIENYAFNACYSLQKLIISDSPSVLQLGYSYWEILRPGDKETLQGLFVSCDLTELYIGRNLSYETKKLLSSISETSPFGGQGIKTVSFGNDVTNIGPYLFRYCRNLQNVKIPKNCKSISTGAFKNTNISNIVIPKSVAAISFSAFYEAPLNEVTFESGDNEIALASNNFNRCKNVFIGRTINEGSSDVIFGDVEIVIVGDSVKTIKSNLFSNCTALKTLDLGKSITEIGENAFSGCGNITQITSRSVVPPTNAIFPNNVYMDANVVVPLNSLNAYKTETNWRNFWNISEMDFSDVDSVTDKSQAEVDVYNLQGVRMRKGVKRSEATQGLPQGIYIINGEKVLVK